MENKIEILAPAGSMDSVIAAVNEAEQTLFIWAKIFRPFFCT